MLTQSVTGNILPEYGSIIGGQQEKGDDWLEVRNPWTREVVGRVAIAAPERVDQVIQLTRAVRIRLSRFERHEILNRLARSIADRAVTISHLITSESGLCLKDTAYEVKRASDVLRFAAVRCLSDDSEVFPCDVSEQGRARRIYTTREPFNLIAAITPFNHPLNQVVHKIAPAIATNNTVVLKPSVRTPLTAFYFAQLCLDAGLPPGMLNVICDTDHGIARQLVRSEHVDLVSFTGGSEVGRWIAANAGYKRLILELGGSSAMLVLEDADIDQAVDIAMVGVYRNGGQRCSAARRLIVHENIADRFAEALAERVSAIRYGDPFDPDVDMGTVITETAAIEIERRVDAAIASGARLLIGHQRTGALYAPTVLDRVDNRYELVTRETFGPVAPIIRFRTLDEAIHIANATPFGLSGAVISNHWPSIQRVISELETGTVNVNAEPSYRLEWSPFGGFKDSGLGDKEGVIEAMKGMTRVKTYSLPWDQP
ncbi:MAG: aldehyde dehydrogenase family protein [Gemmatimonadota bacterium]|jgi:aldehyde dehydrogenase (NAD+)|nr:aldehyde dehydrogenase family protein [Gemmatimonadota bacterium]